MANKRGKFVKTIQDELTRYIGFEFFDIKELNFEYDKFSLMNKLCSLGVSPYTKEKIEESKQVVNDIRCAVVCSNVSTIVNISTQSDISNKEINKELLNILLVIIEDLKV